MNSNQFKEVFRPMIGQITALPNQPHLWRVNYINPGKKRISMEYIGTVVKPETGEGDGRILLKTGETVTAEEFEQAHRRRTSQTLDVQSGEIVQRGGL